MILSLLLMLQSLTCAIDGHLGTVSFYVYRSDAPNLGMITSVNLVTFIPTNQNPYMDTSVIYGRDYYYSVNTLCNVGVDIIRSVISAEMHMQVTGPVQLAWDYVPPDAIRPIF